MKTNQKKNIGILAVGILCLVGTYNAMMIGSDSQISSSNSHKTLEETLGQVTVGRKLAVAQNWNKIEKKEIQVKAVEQKVASVEKKMSTRTLNIVERDDSFQDFRRNIPSPLVVAFLFRLK